MRPWGINRSESLGFNPSSTRTASMCVCLSAKALVQTPYCSKTHEVRDRDRVNKHKTKRENGTCFSAKKLNLMGSS